MEIRRILTIATAISITFVQEQMLVFIPNVSFTVVLIILFSSVLSLKESLIYVFIYVFLDNMYMGGLNLFYMIPMLIGWSLIPISYNTILKKSHDEYRLAIFALIFGFVYGWLFIPFNMIQYAVSSFIPYLLADILFEIVMAISGFLTVIWLFKPLHKVLESLVNQQNLHNKKAYK